MARSSPAVPAGDDSRQSAGAEAESPREPGDPAAERSADPGDPRAIVAPAGVDASGDGRPSRGQPATGGDPGERWGFPAHLLADGDGCVHLPPVARTRARLIVRESRIGECLPDPGPVGADDGGGRTEPGVGVVGAGGTGSGDRGADLRTSPDQHTSGGELSVAGAGDALSVADSDALPDPNADAVPSLHHLPVGANLHLADADSDSASATDERRGDVTQRRSIRWSACADGDVASRIKVVTGAVFDGPAGHRQLLGGSGGTDGSGPCDGGGRRGNRAGDDGAAVIVGGDAGTVKQRGVIE